MIFLYGKKYRLEFLSINEIIELEDIEELRVRKLLSSLRTKKLLLRPLIIEESKNFVIDGHHRLKVLRLLGVKKIPVLLARYGVNIEDTGRWVYIVGSNAKICLSNLLRIIEELEFLTKRGPDYLILDLVKDQIRVSVDRVDLYIALKYVDIPLVKIPQKGMLINTISIILPKLLPKDLYSIVSKGIKLPPRVTYHKTYLKHIIISYSINKLLRY